MLMNPYQNYPQNYPQNYMQNYQPAPQNTGFISVRSIDEVKNYPVAPGNSVMFKDETAPYVYTKTMGYSQLDRPVIERYRFVKENEPEEPKATLNQEPTAYALQSDLDALREEVEALKKERKHEHTSNDKPIKTDDVVKVRDNARYDKRSRCNHSKIDE